MAKGYRKEKITPADIAKRNPEGGFVITPQSLTNEQLKDIIVRSSRQIGQRARRLRKAGFTEESSYYLEAEKELSREGWGTKGLTRGELIKKYTEARKLIRMKVGTVAGATAQAYAIAAQVLGMEESEAIEELSRAQAQAIASAYSSYKATQGTNGSPSATIEQVQKLEKATPASILNLMEKNRAAEEAELEKAKKVAKIIF